MNLEGRKCVVCSAYLFEDDDVVICPECGAPHHRDCYKAIGKCKLADLHGTSEQYKYETPEEKPLSEPQKQDDKKSSILCRGCGAEIESDARFCPYCNMPIEANPGNSPFGVGFTYRFDPNEELEDGVTVGEAAKVVAVNGFRYIPRFKEFSMGKKTSWNWAAFIWPHGWYAFRKMYLISAFFAAMLIVASLLTIPMEKVMGNAPVTENMNNYEVVAVINKEVLSAGVLPPAFATAGLAINLGVRVMAALFADRSYKKNVVESCKEIKKAEDKETALRKKSGVNFLAFGIALLSEVLICNIIISFL